MKPALNLATISVPQFIHHSSVTPLDESPKKMPKPEVAELIDGASMLSENEWVEIARFQREMDEE